MQFVQGVYAVIKDLIYEDGWQFLGPIVAVLILAPLGARVHGAWLGLALFALAAASLALSLRREL